jgi:LysW-gamma-L-lysine carboxypeptidase
MTRRTGTGDMNYFAAKTGAACVTYGPGEPSASHRRGETVSIRDYLKSIEVMVTAISQLGRISREEP